jgi:hypothetical protein
MDTMTMTESAEEKIGRLERELAELRWYKARLVPKGIVRVADRAGARDFVQRLVRGDLPEFEFRIADGWDKLYDPENPLASWEGFRECLLAGPSAPDYEDDASLFLSEDRLSWLKRDGVKGKLKKGEKTGGLYFVPGAGNGGETAQYRLESFLAFC